MGYGNDLISRAEAIDVIRSMIISLGGNEIFHPEAKKSVLRALDDLAAVDAEPVRHGTWDKIVFIDTGEPAGYKCSSCGLGAKKMWKYCHCGARMDGDHRLLEYADNDTAQYADNPTV